MGVYGLAMLEKQPSRRREPGSEFRSRVTLRGR